MERPSPDPDPGPDKDPNSPPRSPKTPAENVKVTPLDEDKHIEQGIEIKET